MVDAGLPCQVVSQGRSPTKNPNLTSTPVTSWGDRQKPFGELQFAS